MILRVWRARIDPARIEEYRRFERERCMPMLRKQPCFLGVLFLRQAEDHALSLTVWEDAGAVEGDRPVAAQLAAALAAAVRDEGHAGESPRTTMSTTAAEARTTA